MAPSWLPKSSKILPKIDPKRHQNFDRFLLRFFIDFGSVWEPSWSHVGGLFRAKTPPRRPKTRPGRPQDATRRPQDTPRRPKTPQDTPKAPKTIPRQRFGEDFWEILEDFEKIFGRICRPTCLLKLTFERSLPPQIRFPKKPI